MKFAILGAHAAHDASRPCVTLIAWLVRLRVFCYLVDYTRHQSQVQLESFTQAERNQFFILVIVTSQCTNETKKLGDRLSLFTISVIIKYTTSDVKTIKQPVVSVTDVSSVPPRRLGCMGCHGSTTLKWPGRRRSTFL